jgi:heme exporter protein A
VRLLHAEAVTLVRGGRLLFEGLDFHLDAGEALHVTGPNGSGKSSLIRLAAGLLRPAAGHIRREAKVALADEHLALDRELPLRKALRLWLPYHPIDAGLEIMGMEGLAQVPVRLLSTGQARKARLVRVVASDAKIWLLDEPMNGLDAEGAERLAIVINSHRRKGGVVLAASHQALGLDWRQLELSR